MSHTDSASYWSEFRRGWRPLAAATVGLSAGMSLNAYVTSIFGPYLLEAFAWSKAAFALMGTLSLVTIILIPVVGRLTDLFGVRVIALPGIIGYPVSLVLLSMLQGDIRVFYALILLQTIFCIGTTTAVYCRLVAQAFNRSRGLALAICACGPAVVGALASPALTSFNEAFGWRAGYQVLAVFSALLGIVTLLLLPRTNREAMLVQRRERNARKDYATILRHPAFWALLTGAFLCSMPHALAYSQIKLMLQEHGVTPMQAGYMVSVFAGGVLLGRFGAGAALDRFPTHIVSAVVMGLPAIGLFIMATDNAPLGLLVLSVALLGLSFGGEADVLAYATAQYFPIAIYSSVVGLLLSAVGVAIGLGSTLLSYTLTLADSFSLFMTVAGTAVITGAFCFLWLGRLQRTTRIGEEIATV
ncbi:MFS transporter [Haliea sp. E17]|uniref:MFS transporter n=1 Tax=Haliea sp. E17 TaxID=3401576 RepID=UPI003AAF56F3